MPAKLKELTVKLPETLVNLWLDQQRKGAKPEKDLTFEMVLSLVRKHTITASRGAEILGMSYQEFLDIMDKHGIPLLDYKPGEVKKGVKALKRVLKENEEKEGKVWG